MRVQDPFLQIQSHMCVLCVYVCVRACIIRILLQIWVTSNIIYVTGFAKRGLIHASDFATLKRHNSIYE